ncbi:MAG: class I SAM-dependent methyltransferase [Deltaproteobacteria bacterium]
MARKYDVSVTYNPYKRFTRAEINRDQFLRRETEEQYNLTGENNHKMLIDTLERLSMTSWNDQIRTVIDFGCGDLRVARFMAGKCTRMIGLDVSPFVLEAAQIKTHEYGLSNCSLKLVDEFDEENVADFLYCLQVLQHNTYEEQMQIVDKIKSLLKPGGYACIHLPKPGNKPEHQNIDTCMYFTKEAVEVLAEGFPWFEILENSIVEGREAYFLWVRK